jgi:nucleoid DNA-binding protein
MTKSELIASIAGEAGITKAQAGVALATFVSSLKDSINETGKFTISGVGTFKKTHREQRTGVNRLGATAGQTWTSPAHNTVTFKPAPALKEAVN